MTRMLDEYLDQSGASPFDRWFRTLSAQSSAKVTTALYRLEQGNASNVKPVGAGVAALRIDFGPGYRVYFGQDGPVLVILLGGGTKKRLQRDIDLARRRWADYKRRKRAAR